MEEFVCTECKGVETNPDAVLTCAYCFSNVHPRCKNLLGSTARRMKTRQYFCNPSCAEIYSKIIGMQNNQTTIINAIKEDLKSAVQSAVSKEVQSMKSEFKNVTAAIEASQDFLSSKFDNIQSDFKELKVENENLKVEVSDLKLSQSTLANKVNKLESNLNKINREAISKNAMFFGLPSVGAENTVNLVCKTCNTFGYDLKPEHLVLANRINTSKTKVDPLAPIKVVFKDISVKEEVFSKKRDFGKLISTSVDPSLVINGKSNNVIIRDELTPFSLELLSELRDLQELLGAKYIWPGRGGVILVKKDENSRPEIVRDRNDISRVMSKFLVSNDKNVSPNQRTTPSPKRKKV